MCASTSTSAHATTYAACCRSSAPSDESNGRREPNVILSQRRADAIRDILANTFKISVKRLQSIGLGEEQLLDPSKPTASVNQQIQIITVAKVAEEAAAPSPAAAPAASSKQAPRKHRN